MGCGTASCSRASVNHMGANPQSRVAPSHGASARSARLEPARATSGAPLGGEPECALAKDADALASHVGVGTSWRLPLEWIWPSSDRAARKWWVDVQS